MANVTLLEILARMNPRIWEIIHPHVPVLGGYRSVTEFDEVALNPQPLPPKEVLASAVLARQMAEGAVLVHAQSRGGQGFLREVVDDWCGTHGPHPWPPGWPHPDPDPDPDPHPWEVAQVFAVAALVFARFASGLEDAELRDAFRAAADAAGERAVRGLDAKG